MCSCRLTKSLSSQNFKQTRVRKVQQFKDLIWHKKFRAFGDGYWIVLIDQIKDKTLKRTNKRSKKERIIDILRMSIFSIILLFMSYTKSLWIFLSPLFQTVSSLFLSTTQKLLAILYHFDCNSSCKYQNISTYKQTT